MIPWFSGLPTLGVLRSDPVLCIYKWRRLGADVTVYLDLPLLYIRDTCYSCLHKLGSEELALDFAGKQAALVFAESEGTHLCSSFIR
jgi:hypothetical protein